MNTESRRREEEGRSSYYTEGSEGSKKSEKRRPNRPWSVRNAEYWHSDGSRRKARKEDGIPIKIELIDEEEEPRASAQLEKNNRRMQERRLIEFATKIRDLDNRYELEKFKLFKETRDARKKLEEDYFGKN